MAVVTFAKIMFVLMLLYGHIVICMYLQKFILRITLGVFYFLLNSR
jgi:hypothetical protein